MLRSATKIIGHRLSAIDGEIGRCVDFLLDDQNWLARYIVAETGPRLGARRVLIAPCALRKGDWTSRRLVLECSRQQVKAAPALDPNGIVSAEHELELSRHYGWTVGGFAPFAADGAQAPELSPVAHNYSPSHPRSETSLRAVKELLGYGVEAEDGSVGHVEDLIVDDDSWSIRYLVVDSQNSWLSGRKLLVPIGWITRLEREAREIQLSVSSARLEGEPEYDPAAPVYDRAERDADADSSGFGSAPVHRSWIFGQRETWNTRGLKAALARIIQG